MNSISRELIQYHGIDDCINLNLKNINQLNIDNIFNIPCCKPDIEQLVKIWVTSNIVKYEVIETPVGSSLEGHTLTGYKLSITGDMNMKISYVADEATQSVHIANTSFPFCGYIILPEGFNPSSRIFPIISIEDIFSKKFNSRCVYSNITFIMSVDIC
ncbi:SPOCS domain-containing protein [Romboutsia sp.]|uniref:SPOCS domain-containing protein n=1 Tax=Romboutsia sp. TaxID=1965302 RepID=UPI003F39DA2B